MGKSFQVIKLKFIIPFSLLKNFDMWNYYYFFFFESLQPFIKWKQIDKFDENIKFHYKYNALEKRYNFFKTV